MGMLIKKKLNRTSWFSKTGLALLLTLSATVLMTDNNAFALGGVISDCSGCHGYTSATPTPIADGASRNDAGKFQGSHNPHVITQSIACSTCHTQPSTNAHANGTVDINAAGSISGGTYPKGSFAVSNGAFSPQSCSNVTCHEPYAAGTTTTPLWGTAATCDACHKGSGALTTTGPATGSHAVHSQTNCSKCHTGATDSATLPSANHMNNNINVANGYPATVTKHTINTGYTGTCSTASCHSNPYASGTITTPVWGVASGCAACHTIASGGSITSTGPATGSHSAHGQTDCSKCHATASTSSTAPTANHADGNINVANGYPATVTKHTINTGYTGTCSTASCHSNPYGSGTITTPVWGNAAGCAACHTVASGGSLTTTGPATGSHAAHAQTDCSKCHATASTSSTAPTANHADGNVNVANGYPATVTKHTINTGYTGTCSTASCHSNPYGSGTSTTPVWGTNAGCDACHSAYPITASGPNTGSHANHHLFACTECHNAGTTAATAPTLNHATGTIDVVNIGYATNVTKHTAGTGYSTCSTLACHVGTTSTTALWGSTTLDCISCHSYTVMIHAGTLAGGTRPAVAANLKSSGTKNHKSTTVGSDATKYDCIVCHMEGNPADGSINGTYHADGFLDFRDPDTGVKITRVKWSGTAYSTTSTDSAGRYVADTLLPYSSSRFQRDLSKTFESDPNYLKIAAIQQNLCLKCHDANGATSTSAQNANAAGTQWRPFGNTTVASTNTQYFVTATVKTAAGNNTGAVMDVNTQLDAANASYHPVTARNNNGYTTGSQMKAPWGNSTKGGAIRGTTTTYGYLLSCFDCHAADNATGVQTGTVVAHGNGTTVAAVTLRGPAMTTNATSASPNLCTECHSDTYATTSNGHASGLSAFNGGSSMSTATMGTCSNCHGSTSTNTVGGRAVNAHGANVNDAGANLGSGSRPYAFIRGTANLTNWQQGQCLGGCTSRTYSPGGIY